MHFKAAVLNFFCVQNLLNEYNKRVHHESIFQTMFLAYPESLRYTYNKFLYSDYFRLVSGRYRCGVAQYLRDSS